MIFLKDPQIVTFSNNWPNYSQMCSLFSLHGLKYLPGKSNMWIKIYWIFTIVAFTLFSLALVQKQYQNYSNNLFEQKFTVLDLENTTVQFPTITICNRQLNDQWNLARLLLNQNYPDSLSIEPFLKDLVTNTWLPDYFFSSEDMSISSSILERASRYFNFLTQNDDYDELVKLVYQNIFQHNSSKIYKTKLKSILSSY